MKLALIGLTLANQSLALALRPVIHDLEIVGHDPDSERVKAARKAKVIDNSHWNLLSACEGADLILLDVSPDEAPTILAALRDEVPAETTLIDHALLLVPRLALLDTLAWPHGNLVSGHLLLKGQGALAEQEPSDDLPYEATYFIAARANTTPKALDMAANLAQAVGALPRFVDAAEHDGLMAATAQMPRLAALVVLGALAEPSGARERLTAWGSELALLEALIGSETPQAQAQGLLSNGPHALHWLDAYGRTLTTVRDLIAAGDEATLSAWLVETRQHIAQWMASAEPVPSEASQGEQFRSMFLGGLRRRRS